SGSQDIAVTLAEVKSLIRQEPSFVPLYRFYRKVATELHLRDQNDDIIWDLLDALEQAPEHYKHSHNFMIDHVEAYQAVKDWKRAESLTLELAETDIDAYELYSVKANFYRNKGNYLKALDNILHAHQLKPSLQVTRNTAIIYLLNANYKEATTYLDQVIKAAPNDFWALKTYADLSLVSGEVNRAIEGYLRLLASTSNDALTLTNLAIAYSLVGNFELSNEYATKAHQLSPTNLSIALNLADSYSYLGKLDQAKRIYEQLLLQTQHTKDLDDLVIRIQALAHTGKTVEALRKINQLEMENSNVYDLRFVKAMVLTKLGESHSALIAIEESIQQGWSNAFFALPWFKPLCKHDSQLLTIIGAKNMKMLCTY
ncbi:MAG: tetratricopeptide repeat protein, partial [Pseudoalteromonas marina]